MCHYVLLLPVMALPIFWLLPWRVSTPVYLGVLLVAGFFYFVIVRAMHKRPQTGAESLIGVKAEVVSKLGPVEQAQYLVCSQGKLWSARSHDSLAPGDKVSVRALDGIMLIVERGNE